MKYTPAPTFPSLGEGFSDAAEAARFPQHVLRFRNQRWAERVGLGALDDVAWEQHFARFEPLADNLPRPLALRYHGHQFDVYNPAIGDGRGFLFAQLRDDEGRLLDLATKGSGTTRWSRGGDGRLTLKGGVREVLATEMLEALGVYTSKSFSLFETGESLVRGDEPSPTRSSVLVRLGHSHVRIGTFQRLSQERDETRLRALLDYSVEHYAGADAELARAEDRPAAFLRVVTERSAALCASWMVAGFVHGVLNSDNMNITGESFDYGPYRFLPTYDPEFTAAYFDHAGLYAFAQQPRAVFRNLGRLADCLRALSPAAPFGELLRAFEPALRQGVQTKLLARLGLSSQGHDTDMALVDAVFAFLEASRVGYARFFFDWYGGFASERRAVESPACDSYRGEKFRALLALFELYVPRDASRLAHPYFQRTEPCDLLVDEIEAIWSRIAHVDDWSPFDAKIVAIREMGDALGQRRRQTLASHGC